MGNISFVLCHEKNRYDTNKQKVNNKVKLMEYYTKKIYTILNRTIIAIKQSQNWGEVLYSINEIFSKEHSVVRFDMLKASLDHCYGRHIMEVIKT